MYHIGVDLGGTNIKAGVVSAEAVLLCSRSLPTKVPRSGEEICDDIVVAVELAMKDVGIGWDDIADVGLGCPGSVDPEHGIVGLAANLDFHDFPLIRTVSERVPAGIQVYAGNDANVAALGEFYAGSAKGSHSAVIITLGTGVGSGIIIDSKLVTGYNHFGGEFGHSVIEMNGYPCTCGRKGCFESYSSATGLIRLTQEEMARSPHSLMHHLAKQEGKVSGKTAFDAMKQGDEAGKRVTELYLDYLACGLANVINALQPEVLSIGGGVSKEGDPLLLPLQDKVFEQVFGGKSEKHTSIRLCTLGNDAGMIGAAMLGKNSLSLST